MPGPESGTDTNMFYSFDYHNVHFIALSTESDYPGSPYDPSPEEIAMGIEPQLEEEYYFQVNWLQDDLAKAVANRDQVPWIIVLAHRPMYSPDQETDGVPTHTSAQVQAWLEPVFAEYDVDFYITGHVHAYARMYPTFENQPVSVRHPPLSPAQSCLCLLPSISLCPEAMLPSSAADELLHRTTTTTPRLQCTWLPVVQATVRA